MKKLIALLLTVVFLLLAASACASGSTAPETRGSLAVAYDRALTEELLAYFQANQNVTVTGTLLNDETDYAKLTSVVALVKDDAIAQKLLNAGWSEAANWTDAQKETNAGMFNFTVLIAPTLTDSGKIAAKYLTDWLVGDGAYARTISTVSGGCSCKRVETTVTMKSDAPVLFKSGQFAELAN